MLSKETMMVGIPSAGPERMSRRAVAAIGATALVDRLVGTRFATGWDSANPITSAHPSGSEDVPLTDAFLGESFLPQLHAWGIALTVNVTGATHAQCGNHLSRLSDEAEAIQRLLDLGGQISALSLQSPLSKVSGSCPAYGRETGHDLRIADIVRYMTAMTERFPGIAIGLVDAMPAKGWAYEDVYRRLQDTLASQGLELAFIHLDFPKESAAPG